ncbi:hypothetical protein T492DRAFT_442767 [Pavlovales sp. CCMP2436]|nr:hypothetical protein T492DRAFT_442767 [Pavlovales sp. CCMP2436]
MVFRKLHLGSHCLTSHAIDEVAGNECPPPLILFTFHPIPCPYFSYINSGLLRDSLRADATGSQPAPLATLARDSLLAIALCHNVSPVASGDSFQGASPDELALVAFAASAGLLLVARDLRHIVLKTRDGAELEYEILQVRVRPYDWKHETK